MPYCRNCGTQLCENVQYCYNCGTAITPPTKTTSPLSPIVVSAVQQQQQKNTHEKTSSRPIHTNTLFLLMLLVLIITAIALLLAAVSLSSINFSINWQPFFDQPGINRVNWNMQKITNDIPAYLHLIKL